MTRIKSVREPSKKNSRNKKEFVVVAVVAVVVVVVVVADPTPTPPPPPRYRCAKTITNSDDGHYANEMRPPPAAPPSAAVGVDDRFSRALPILNFFFCFVFFFGGVSRISDDPSSLVFVDSSPSILSLRILSAILDDGVVVFLSHSL